MYWDPQFPCPETRAEPPRARAEVFTCQPLVLTALNAQTLARAPGLKYVYSDLSMITLMFVLGRLARQHGYVTQSDLLPSCAAAYAASAEDERSSSANDGGANERANDGARDGGDYVRGIDQCYYEAYLRRFVFDKLVAAASPVPGAHPPPAPGPAPARFMGFVPPQALWDRCLPTWNDTANCAPAGGPPYRDRLMQASTAPSPLKQPPSLQSYESLDLFPTTQLGI